MKVLLPVSLFAPYLTSPSRHDRVSVAAPRNRPGVQSASTPPAAYLSAASFGSSVPPKPRFHFASKFKGKHLGPLIVSHAASAPVKPCLFAVRFTVPATTERRRSVERIGCRRFPAHLCFKPVSPSARSAKVSVMNASVKLAPFVPGCLTLRSSGPADAGRLTQTR
jgi:hypothetical protein